MNSAITAKKALERIFLARMLADLGWEDDGVEDGSEPPDFIVRRGAKRVAVEVTRIYWRENRKGSPEAEREREDIRFVAKLADAYNAEARSQLFSVSVVLPSAIESRAVRQFTREERHADRANVARKALARLRHLPRLKEGASHRVAVRQRDGRSVAFHITRLPESARELCRWRPVNISVGWVSTVTPEALATKITAKASDLRRYRAAVDSAVLLIVADGRRASGFLNLRDGTLVEAGGFDAVYFQRFPEYTRPVTQTLSRHR